MATTTSPISTPFGATSTAADVVQGVDLTGKRAIVTGGASGIGVETARALAGAGAEVTLAVRRVGPAEDVATDIRATTGNAAVRVAPLELVDPASIAAFAAAWSGHLDILVNNAGVMAIQELSRSASGQEMQFATNHLGHFALALALHPALAAADDARIVWVSSSGHLRSPVVFDDLDYRFRDYDPFGAYGKSKTANVLFAVEATRRWAKDGITANALMPGGIFTALQRHVGGGEYINQARQRFAQAGVGSRLLNRVRRRPSSSPRRPCSRASAAATSRTATKPPPSHRAHRRHHRGGRALRPRPRQRRAPVGHLARPHRRLSRPRQTGTCSSSALQRGKRGSPDRVTQGPESARTGLDRWPISGLCPLPRRPFPTAQSCLARPIGGSPSWDQQPPGDREGRQRPRQRKQDRNVNTSSLRRAVAATTVCAASSPRCSQPLVRPPTPAPAATARTVR